jgi:hypothetical protein
MPEAESQMIVGEVRAMVVEGPLGGLSLSTHACLLAAYVCCALLHAFAPSFFFCFCDLMCLMTLWSATGRDVGAGSSRWPEGIVIRDLVT